MAVIALFFADRLRNLETRKKWGIIFILWLFCRDILPYLILFGLGSTFTTISIGNSFIPSRRNMTEIGTLTALPITIIIALVWLFRTNKESRKRGLYMFGVMLILMIAWTFGEWLAGQRWIEVGPEEGPWTLAPPLIHIGMLLYDIVVEMGLFTLSFLAIPSLLKLIKKEE
jgi:hypothetical protein